jgi:putative transposase
LGATITNQRQVRDDPDRLGWAVSKLWNVSRYYVQRQWDETGETHDDGEPKGHERYTDLHSQYVEEWVEQGVGTLVVGDLGGVRRRER